MTDDKRVKWYALTFDTETIGFPSPKLAFGRHHHPSKTECYNSARLLEISWRVRDDSGHLVKSKSMLIKPSGWKVAATEIHKITQEKADREGIEVKRVLLEFWSDAKICQKIVGHNVNFDMNVVCSEFYRMGLTSIARAFARLNFQCTMYGGKLLYQKNHKLNDLHKVIFGGHFDNAHRAEADTIATERCFYMMVTGVDTFAIDNQEKKEEAKDAPAAAAAAAVQP